ncbi:KIN4A [Scenedesmus sp. PABB004]|nr:KIN4A [Scenedesmus sp. PABB004]
MDESSYTTDVFRIWYCKRIMCSRRDKHDWQACPFYHSGEKAHRRDPRTHGSNLCPSIEKTGECPHGEKCQNAHTVFEARLHPNKCAPVLRAAPRRARPGAAGVPPPNHPRRAARRGRARYRTTLCSEGLNCSRKLCFFAHTVDELRTDVSVPQVPVGYDEYMALQPQVPTPHSGHSSHHSGHHGGGHGGGRHEPRHDSRHEPRGEPRGDPGGGGGGGGGHVPHQPYALIGGPGGPPSSAGSSGGHMPDGHAGGGGGGGGGGGYYVRKSDTGGGGGGQPMVMYLQGAPPPGAQLLAAPPGAAFAAPGGVVYGGGGGPVFAPPSMAGGGGGGGGGGGPPSNTTMLLQQQHHAAQGGAQTPYGSYGQGAPPGQQGGPQGTGVFTSTQLLQALQGGSGGSGSSASGAPYAQAHQLGGRGGSGPLPPQGAQVMVAQLPPGPAQQQVHEAPMPPPRAALPASTAAASPSGGASPHPAAGGATAAMFAAIASSDGRPAQPANGSRAPALQGPGARGVPAARGSGSGGGGPASGGGAAAAAAALAAAEAKQQKLQDMLRAALNEITVLKSRAHAAEEKLAAAESYMSKAALQALLAAGAAPRAGGARAAGGGEEGAAAEDKDGAVAEGKDGAAAEGKAGAAADGKADAAATARAAADDEPVDVGLLPVSLAMLPDSQLAVVLPKAMSVRDVREVVRAVMSRGGVTEAGVRCADATIKAQLELARETEAGQRAQRANLASARAEAAAAAAARDKMEVRYRSHKASALGAALEAAAARAEAETAAAALAEARASAANAWAVVSQAAAAKGLTSWADAVSDGDDDEGGGADQDPAPAPAPPAAAAAGGSTRASADGAAPAAAAAAAAGGGSARASVDGAAPAAAVEAPARAADAADAADATDAADAGDEAAPAGSDDQAAGAGAGDGASDAPDHHPSRQSAPPPAQAAPALSADDGPGGAPTPSAVKVAVVVRPLLDFEAAGGATPHVAVRPPNAVSLPPRPGAPTGVNDGAFDFCFDRVYLASSGAAGGALFDDMVAPVVGRYVRGFNATVLAYGQTGSGKTYTMGTAARGGPGGSAGGGPGGGGVIRQACGRVLEHMAAVAGQYEVSLKVSFVEIYNESIQDLLTAPAPLAHSGSAGSLAALRAGGRAGGGGGGADGSCSTPRSGCSDAGGAPWAAFGATAGGPEGGGVAIRESARGEIVLDGAAERSVACMADLAALLDAGNAVRATAAHRMNQASSRSHAVVVLALEQRARPSAALGLPPELRLLRSKLHLVDLAGSERAKDTGTTGARFDEGVSINKGLLQLGCVINALTEGTARRHIPYRNSKLTRLLQDSLGGNSETLFIACASPAPSNRDHTISTLRYASRAMAIKNSLKRPAMTADEELAYLRGLVAALTDENRGLRAALAAGSGGTRAGGGGGAAPCAPAARAPCAAPCAPAGAPPPGVAVVQVRALSARA